MIDQILQGITNCLCKLDDNLIEGQGELENLDILEEVLKRLSKHNIHLNLNNCEFLINQVVYLGLEFSSQGLRPVKSKIAAMKNARTHLN